MEKATVIALLEKYFQAETTIAEEQALAAYFRGDGVDAELLSYRELFAYFHEEARVSAGSGFGDRILQRLGLPLDGETASKAPAPHPAAADVTGPAPEPVVPIAREPFRLGVAAAAAAIIVIVAGLSLLKPAGRPTILADTRPAAQARSNNATERSRVTDTYDDPEQALAAVRHALLIASKNLNQGRRELSGDHK